MNAIWFTKGFLNFRIWHRGQLLILILLFSATSALGFLFWERGTFPCNEEGAYFDGVVVYHQSTVEVLGILFSLLSMSTVLVLFWIVRKAKK